MANYIEPSRPISELTVFSLDHRRPLYKEGFPFVIFWSEKAACTVVAKWFFLQIGLLDEAMKYSPWIHHYEGTVFQANKLTYLGKVLAALKSGVPAVKFVRDPYARAFSGFLELHRPHALSNPTNWSTQVRRRVISDISSPNASIESTFSFRQYLLWRASKKNNEVDGHIAQQYVARDDCIPMQIVKVEGSRRAFARLEEDFFLPVSSAKHDYIFESDHHHKSDVRYSAEETIKILDLGMPLRRPKNFPLPRFDRNIAVSAGLDKLIKLSFGIDIEKYGYGSSSETESGDAPEIEYDRMLTALADERNQLLSANKSLNVERDQLLLERDLIVSQSNSRKEALDRALVQPSALSRWLIDKNVFPIRIFIEEWEAWRLARLKFDAQFYLACNPDVKASGLDPRLHFIRHGRREGRQFRLEET